LPSRDDPHALDYRSVGWKVRTAQRERTGFQPESDERVSAIEHKLGAAAQTIVRPRAELRHTKSAGMGTAVTTLGSVKATLWLVDGVQDPATMAIAAIRNWRMWQHYSSR
jgi:hypothetical protein